MAEASWDSVSDTVEALRTDTHRSLTPEPVSGRPASFAVLPSTKHKPPVHPKPDNLHSRPISSLDRHVNGSMRPASANPVSPDALDERFARLRMSEHGSTKSDSPSSDCKYERPAWQSAEMSGFAEANGVVIRPKGHGTSGTLKEFTASPPSKPAERPLGPRERPTQLPGPPPPPKVSLDPPFISAMPKLPSPAYSPARNIPTPAAINPPRSTARSMVGTGGRGNSLLASTASSRQDNDAEGDSYFPKASNNVHPGPAPRRKSLHLPIETVISAEKLYDYNKMFNVLLIDVRGREEFDQGHIFSLSIMCIEPTAMRREMSAEELQDSLVLSPDDEQSMFERRDTFDLVVYYDQNTASNHYLSRSSRNDSEQALKYLHDTLYEFNQEKPLQRPPILLSGGIDAWEDIVGRQALATSRTVSLILEKKSRAGRPPARVPVPSSSSRLYLQKKRMRDYNPLNAEEERKWLERARSESVNVPQLPDAEQEHEAAPVTEATPIIRDYNDFYRRFPEAYAIEQQSMMIPPSRPPIRTPPPAPMSPPHRPPPPMPDYPTSAVPQVPARPPPTLARPSYYGVRDVDSQALTSLRLAPYLAPYIPPKYIPRDIRLPKTGLINFGVTCYLNATVQCMSATTVLSRFFLDDGFRVNVQKDNWKGSKGIMPELYSNLVRELWKGDVYAVRPKSLRVRLCQDNEKIWTPG